MKLVTGASGFVGSSLVRHLASISAAVRVVSRVPEACPALGSGSFEVVRADLRTVAWRDLLEGVDTVFHLAAQTSGAAIDPVDSRSINVAPVEALIRACRALRRPPLVVFAAAETQCGVATRLPIDETHEDRPVTVYDSQKLEAERLLLDATSRGEIRATSLRLTTVYGPGPAPQAADRGVVRKLVSRALRGEAITIYGDGSTLRDFLYVDDAAAAFVAAAAKHGAVEGRAFIVGSGRRSSLAELATAIAGAVRAATGREAAIAYVAPPEARSEIVDADVVVDTRRFRDATGWRPGFDLETGLRETIAALAI